MTDKLWWWCVRPGYWRVGQKWKIEPMAEAVLERGGWWVYFLKVADGTDGPFRTLAGAKRSAVERLREAGFR